MTEEETAPSAGHTAHEALRRLYHAATCGDSTDPVAAEEAYLQLIEYMGTHRQPGVSPDRVRAAGRMLLESGDITHMGARMLNKIAGECR